MAQPLRHSPQRQTILRIVKFSDRPLSAADISRGVRRVLPKLGRATLYRNLESLAAVGEIAEVPTDDGIRRYVGSEWHDATFTCQRCGKTRRLTSRTLPTYVDRKMFGDQTIFTSTLRATGLCATCAKKRGR